MDEAEVASALGDFDKLWETLAPREQSRVLELLGEWVDYDGEHGRISLMFHPAGIKSLTHELANHQEDAA
jgi:site-specific DNA recombinase